MVEHGEWLMKVNSYWWLMTGKNVVNKRGIARSSDQEDTSPIWLMMFHSEHWLITLTILNGNQQYQANRRSSQQHQNLWSLFCQDLTEQQKKSIAQHLEEAVEKVVEKEKSASYISFLFILYSVFLIFFLFLFHPFFSLFFSLPLSLSFVFGTTFYHNSKIYKHLEEAVARATSQKDFEFLSQELLGVDIVHLLVQVGQAM